MRRHEPSPVKIFIFGLEESEPLICVMLDVPSYVHAFSVFSTDGAEMTTYEEDPTVGIRELVLNVLKT